MAYANTTPATMGTQPASVFGVIADAISAFFLRAEAFADEADAERRIHLLNSVSDETLGRMGLERGDIRAYVLGN